MAQPLGENRPSTWITIRRDAMRWDLDQSLPADWLGEHGELPISLWLKTGVAEIVKTGPHRTVYRLHMPEGIYYLKHYRTADWQALLQNLVRPCRAELEYRAANCLVSAGINTFETVALGRRAFCGLVGDNYLISREIADSQPLDDFVLQTFANLSANQQQLRRRQIARKLGDMTAKLHERGLIHRDLHPGNVLLQWPGKRLELHLIDLHALVQKPRITWRQQALNLSLLNNFFARLSSKADRLRFLRQYLKGWNHAAAERHWLGREFIRFVNQVCISELAKADCRGDKKWRRGNRRLLILDSAGARCRGLAGLGRDFLKSLRSQPERLLQQPYLIERLSDPTGLPRAVVELSLHKKPQRGILTAFTKGHLAWNAWEMGHAMHRRRLSVPQPLLVVESVNGHGDYLVTEEVSGAISLARYLSEQHRKLALNEWHQKLVSLLPQLAVQLSKLHSLGFYQQPLRLNSVFIGVSEGDAQLWFAGLEWFHQVSTVDRGQVARSFSDLLADIPADWELSSSIYLRCLRSYLGSAFCREWKTIWRQIALGSGNSCDREAA